MASGREALLLLGVCVALADGPAEEPSKCRLDGGFADTSDTTIRHIETHYGKHYKISQMVLSHANTVTGLINPNQIYVAFWPMVCEDSKSERGENNVLKFD